MNVLNFARAGLVAAACFAAPALYAGNVTLYPNSPGVGGIAGTTATSAPGFGNGAFKESGNSKGELYVTPGQLFGHSVLFSQIASISYFTNKPTNANPNVSPGVDWSFYLYTNPQTGDTRFYHSRLTSEPLYYQTAQPAANTWHQWMSGGSEPMTFYDQNNDAGFQGTSADPTFATLKAGPYTWTHSGTTVDYRNESILYFSLQTGSAWSAGFMGLVDGMTITLVNGEIGTVNLEAAPAAVPEPESLALFALGIGALVAAGRRKRATR